MDDFCAKDKYDRWIDLIQHEHRGVVRWAGVGSAVMGPELARAVGEWLIRWADQVEDDNERGENDEQ